MIFESFPVGPFQCNCMVIGCEKTRSAVIIDPGEDAGKILEVLSRHRLKTIYLLHTHAHLDHMGATKTLHQNTGGTTCLHEDDMFLCEHLSDQAAFFGLPTPETPEIGQFLNNGDSLSFGSGRAEVLHTPGHTPGSLSFYVPDIGLLTGDTLFSGSVGRTDLWKGSQSTLISSVKQRLLSFPDETVVFPGHGPSTTIEQERKENPFLT